ncbi:hypothetical protein ACGFIW_32390 [Micromonospora sp. NPDC048935]|uniref:hypothetical protein n=1 Tax=Micromonospora sp. NPDC048935 TaxID=3364262 RepID=UPI00371F8237
MKDILDTPAERDLPPGEAARMRADLMTSIRRPRRRRRTGVRLGIATVATAAAVVAGVAMVPNDEQVRHLAMGSSELSPTLHRAMEQCLKWNAQHERLPVSIDDLAVAAEQDHRAVALFMTKTGYFTCNVARPPHEEVTGGTSGERVWPQRDWLPGSIQQLLLMSSKVDGGDVAVTGRVSARVHRLVLEHGDGHTTTARLVNGVFGLLTEGANVTRDAELISYDATGSEIDRRLLFRPSMQFDYCYVDSAGTLVYGEPGVDCRPAEPWGR